MEGSSVFGSVPAPTQRCGLARDRRTQEDGALHLYFTGCAGDVTPGKYNDGSPAGRLALAERLHEAMVASEEGTLRLPVSAPNWRVWKGRLHDSEEKEADLHRTLRDTAES